MKKLSIFISILTMLLIGLQGHIVWAGDLDELKALCQKYRQAIVTRNLDQIAECVKGSVESCCKFPCSRDYTKSSANEIKAFFKKWYETIEYYNIIPGFDQVRILGTTAIMWGNFIEKSKENGGFMQQKGVRYTSVYNKTDGKWRLVSTHRDDYNPQFDPDELEEQMAKYSPQPELVSIQRDFDPDEYEEQRQKYLP